MVLRTITAVPEDIQASFLNVSFFTSPRKLVKKRDFRDPIQMESLRVATNVCILSKPLLQDTTIKYSSGKLKKRIYRGFY